MKWYIPSWNGDFRLEPLEESPDKTRITTYKPTPSELEIFASLLDELKVPNAGKAVMLASSVESHEIVVAHPLETVGPIATRLMHGNNPAVLTAVRFSDGHVETVSGTGPELQALAYRSAPASAMVKSDKPDESEPPEEPKAEAAATVKRPTPCCPQCTPGSIAPARETLLAFLSPKEHEQWAHSRAIVVTGGLSGHRYILAHRQSELAARFGKIAYDIDGEGVMHFHDWSVPPEEEVLAAKLILEHREPWLRNEATAFDLRDQDHLFKNPFGDGGDGVADSRLMQSIGHALGVSDRMG